jgi:hypothetical protein
MGGCIVIVYSFIAGIQIGISCLGYMYGTAHTHVMVMVSSRALLGWLGVYRNSI